MMLRRQFVCATLFICAAAAIMAPRLAAPQFGLLDDGVTLAVADRAIHDPLFLADLEATRGRFRPASWVYYVAQYPLWGTAPLGYFVVQCLALAATSFLLYEAVRTLSASRLAGLTSGLAFLTAAPIWENYYTLSKPEPVLALFLALSTLFLFKSIRESATSGSRPRSLPGASAVLAGLAYFTKETSVVMLPISIALVIITRRCPKRVRSTAIVYAVANVVWFSGYFLLRNASHTYAISLGNDSLHYSLALDRIHASIVDALAWILRDFAYAIPLILAATWLVRRRSELTGLWLVLSYGAVFSLGWIAIMLPWHSSLEYYLLPLTLGVALMVGASLEILRRRIRSLVPAARLALGGSLLCALGLWPVTLVNGITTGRVQLAIDTMNVGLLHELAQALPADGRVLVNLSNGNEYVFEMRLQLPMFFDRVDLTVNELGNAQPIADSDALVAIPRVTNKQIVMPRFAADDASSILPVGMSLGVEPTRVYAGSRQVQLLFVAPEEPMCQLLRRMGAAAGYLCQIPRRLVDRRTFTFGWELYRPTTRTADFSSSPPTR